MKKIAAVILLLFIAKSTLSQSTYKSYSWEIAKTLSPDSVFSIVFEKGKLTKLPSQIYSYTNLKKLDISRNKFSKLSDSIQLFYQLEVLNLGKNKFTEFPIEILNLLKLRKLYLNRNDISILPETIERLTKLESIDLWETPIEKFPDAFIAMKHLKYIDSRGVTHGAKYQDFWIESLPWIKIEFDTPCNCEN